MLYGQHDPPPYCTLLILAQSNFLLLLHRVLMFVSPSSCDSTWWPINGTFSNALTCSVLSSLAIGSSYVVLAVTRNCSSMGFSQHDDWIHVIPRYALFSLQWQLDAIHCSDYYSPNVRNVGSEIIGIVILGTLTTVSDSKFRFASA